MLQDSLAEVLPLEELRTARETGQVQMRYCGISVPLLTFRPKIYVLIFVRNELWFAETLRRAKNAGHPFELNWEYQGRREFITGRRRDSVLLVSMPSGCGRHCEEFGLRHDESDGGLRLVWRVLVLGEQAADVAPQGRPHLLLLVPVDGGVAPDDGDELVGDGFQHIVTELKHG